MPKYRSKPTIKEAIQYTGENIQEILDFMGINKKAPLAEGMRLTISTLEGNMHVSINDYVIKGIANEFYPCKPNIFEATYEKVED